MTVYVGNLKFEVDDESLRRLFSEIGPVNNAHVLRDNQTRMSRGFGFVSFVHAADAPRAIERLNGTVHDGRELKVSPADSQKVPGPRGGGGSGSAGGGGGGGGGAGSAYRDSNRDSSLRTSGCVCILYMRGARTKAKICDF
jgi:RNA recognition motif-containing protein